MSVQPRAAYIKVRDVLKLNGVSGSGNTNTTYLFTVYSEPGDERCSHLLFLFFQIKIIQAPKPSAANVASKTTHPADVASTAIQGTCGEAGQSHQHPNQISTYRSASVTD